MTHSFGFFLPEKKLSPFGVVFRVLSILGSDKTLMSDQAPFLISGVDAPGWRNQKFNTIVFNFSVLSYKKIVQDKGLIDPGFTACV